VCHASMGGDVEPNVTDGQRGNEPKLNMNLARTTSGIAEFSKLLSVIDQ
jgi:hypothetical protein